MDLIIVVMLQEQVAHSEVALSQFLIPSAAMLKRIKKKIKKKKYILCLHDRIWI